MDKKSPPKADQPRAEKIIIWVFVFFILASIGATFWRIIVKKDYIISAQADCDSYAEKCFVWQCDPESLEEGIACTGNKEKDVWHYQIVKRKAFNIPLCDPNSETCEALVCPEGEANCETIFCDEISAQEQGALCNDPVQYSTDNPLNENSGEISISEN